MIERKYRITSNCCIVAESMTLEDALTLIEALFNKYDQDLDAEYTIRVQYSCEAVNSL